MNGKGQRLRAGGILSALLSLAGAAALPFYFIHSDVISGFLAGTLGLSPAAELSGGRIAAQFSDPLGDDRGAGFLEPPGSPCFGEGELDLVGYTVRTPLVRSVWADGRSFWQLEVRFARAVPAGLAGGGFRAPAVHIYIDLDGPASGSVESAYGEGELVRFSPSRPWDYAISAKGLAASAEIRSADGAYHAPVRQIWNGKEGRLVLRVDLLRAPALLVSILDGRETAHYVLIGARDDAREGGFAAVREFPSLHAGGGARDELTPRVFDLLSPPGFSQAALLSSGDAASGRLARLEPVVAPGRMGAQGSRPSAVGDPGLRTRLETEARRDAEEAEKTRRKRAANLPAPEPAADSRILGELFELGLEERCRVAADYALERDGGDPVALAYRGALTALRADSARGLAEKMRLVEEAYRDLDRAVEAVAEPGAGASAEEALSVLLCRAYVSSAVPDAVFGRAAQGASDFDAAARAVSGDSRRRASCLAEAARAYEKAGLREDAGVRWATLSELPELPAALRLELLDRGLASNDGGPRE